MEQTLPGPHVKRPPDVPSCKTSDGRFWTGFEGLLYEVHDGSVPARVNPTHSIAMLAGAPIRTFCRCDGLASQRLQLPGDIDLVPAGASVAWEFAGSSRIVEVTLSTTLLRTAAEGMGVKPERGELAPHLQVRDPLLEHVLWALKAELEFDAPLGRLYADSLGLALAAHLLRRYTAVAPRTSEGGLSKGRLQRVLDYIHDNIAQDLSLAELAAVAELSPSHFKALFRRSAGVPVHQYVIRARVDHASDLLLRNRLPVSEVALLAGFANQSHLSRCMRRVVGTTPGTLLRRAG
ncbi:MAG: helix-turn-helix domain-containing protein [Vulcanimicrobiaceae bacterium]